MFREQFEQGTFVGDPPHSGVAPGDIDAAPWARILLQLIEGCLYALLSG